MLQLERAAQLRPRVAAVALPDAAQQPEAPAQYEQVSPPVWERQPELRVQATQVLALEQPLERVQPASLPGQREPPQVSPRLAALLGELAAEPRPLPSSA